MAATRELTIKTQVFNKTPAGYGGFNLYLAEEPDQHYFNRKSDVYLLTQESYFKGSKVVMGPDIEPLTHSMSSKIDGIKVYLKKPKDLTLSGYFKIIARMPATSPFEEFSSGTLPMDRFTQYLVEHFDGPANSGKRYKVFSEVDYFKGEDIPANETKRVYRRYPSESLEYFVHDKAMYIKRATKAFTGLKNG